MNRHRSKFLIIGLAIFCLAVYSGKEAIAYGKDKANKTHKTAETSSRFSGAPKPSTQTRPLRNWGEISTKANRLFLRLNKDAVVNIDVLGLSGNLIKRYWNGLLPSGNYSMEPMDGHPLSKGTSVCLIRVSIDSYSDFKSLYPNQRLD